MKAAAAAVVLCFLAGGCAAQRAGSSSPSSQEKPEATSLLGEPLFAPALPTERRAEFEARLGAARAEWEKEPGDVDAIIWLGRRTAYLGRFREAIEIFSTGIRQHPRDPRLFRHRGHRYITVRRFDLAEKDLERAAALVEGVADEIEPDGIPNARNTPTSTLQSNVWYHLGLARYLRGDFVRALDAYRRGIALSKNDDTLVAMSHWLYMTLRRLGREEEAASVLAPIGDVMDVVENGDYHRLLRMYQGKLTPAQLVEESGSAGSVADATVGYGIGNWHLSNGRRDDALRTLRGILAGGQWPAFGYIAAEADMKRMGER